jgi:hypothetical protein
LTARVAVVATDVGAWRVVAPVVSALRRRGAQVALFLAPPAANFAADEGHDPTRLDATDPEASAAVALASAPGVLLLGTSTRRPVVERALACAARGRVPTVAVLDAMLFAADRFGPAMADLPDLIACPDVETADYLAGAGVARDRLVVTGHPGLEAIEPVGWQPRQPGEPIDVLFVSQPVPDSGGPSDAFSLDEQQTLSDLLAACQQALDLAPDGLRVRVRWHPTQAGHALPAEPTGVSLTVDTAANSLASAAAAKLVVGLSSSLLAEARMLPRPTLAYLPGPYWDAEPVYPPHLGVAIARSREELLAHLRRALRESPTPPPTAWHRGAAIRIAALVLQAASRSQRSHL